MKRAIIEVTPQLLIEMCKANPDPSYVRVVNNALPDDAHCVGGYYDSLRHVFQLAIRSESFPDVPDPVKSPVLLPPVFKIEYGKSHQLVGHLRLALAKLDQLTKSTCHLEYHELDMAGVSRAELREALALLGEAAE